MAEAELLALVGVRDEDVAERIAIVLDELYLTIPDDDHQFVDTGVK